MLRPGDYIQVFEQVDEEGDTRRAEEMVSCTGEAIVIADPHCYQTGVMHIVAVYEQEGVVGGVMYRFGEE